MVERLIFGSHIKINENVQGYYRHTLKLIVWFYSFEV